MFGKNCEEAGATHAAAHTCRAAAAGGGSAGFAGMISYARKVVVFLSRPRGKSPAPHSPAATTVELHVFKATRLKPVKALKEGVFRGGVMSSCLCA